MRSIAGPEFNVERDAEGSDGDRRGDVRMGLVILEHEVVGLVIEQPLPAVLDNEARQRPPCMVFCVQFAAEFTSAAAPRTVLHAATARHAPTSNRVVNF